MNRSTPGLPVHHQFPEFTQTHIHRVSDAIQPSHPLLSPSPLAPSKQRVPVLALTSLGENAISNQADCTLRLTTRERLYSKIGSFTTNDSIHCLLDLLYAGVFSTDYETNMAYKVQISKRFDHRKSSSEVMQEEEHPFT